MIEHLIEATYSRSHQICSYIKTTFDVHYSVSGLNKWLHHNGFNYKHSKGVPHKFCTDKQNNFVTKYDSLKDKMLENDVLLFIDAVHRTQATKVTFG